MPGTPEDEDKGLDICEQRKNLYTLAAFGNEHAKYIPISRALGTHCIVEPINIYQCVIIYRPANNLQIIFDNSFVAPLLNLDATRPELLSPYPGKISLVAFLVYWDLKKRL